MRKPSNISMNIEKEFVTCLLQVVKFDHLLIYIHFDLKGLTKGEC